MDQITLMEDSYLDGKEAGLATGIAIGEAQGIVKGIAMGEAKGIAMGEAKGITEGIAIGEVQGELKGMQKTQLELLESMNQAESLEDFMRLREQLRTAIGNTQSI
jgi:hypothetical protein